jgi:hypothetical protein
MNLAHPTPWQIKPCPTLGGYRVKDANGRTINHADDWRTAALICTAPLLLSTLRDLVERCDGSEGVRADGSNIQTMRAHNVLAILHDVT